MGNLDKSTNIHIPFLHCIIFAKSQRGWLFGDGEQDGGSVGLLVLGTSHGLLWQGVRGLFGLP